MKTMTCAEMGGPCDTKMTAGSEKEMTDAGWKHVMEAHPDMAEKMKDMPKEAMDKWSADFHKKWEETPDSGE